MEEIQEIDLDFPEKDELIVLAEESRARGFAVEEIGELSSAEVEVLEEDFENRNVEITVGAKVPHMPTFKVGQSCKITTEHTIKVVNNSNRTVQGNVYYEWVIPGVHRVKIWPFGIYVKRRKTRFFRFTLPSRWFTFTKEGKYQLFARTRFLWGDVTEKSNEFEVKKK
ncbi:hypothetical protein [Candidatus Pyrohabitans sp.]